MFKIKNKFKTELIFKNLIIASLVLIAQPALACTVTQLKGSTTKIVVDPNSKEVYINIPDEGVQFSNCAANTSHISIKRNVSFNFLNSRSQSVEKIENLNLQKNCSIQTDIDTFSKLDAEKYSNTVKTKNELLNQCLSYVVTQTAKQPVIADADVNCQVNYLAADKSVAELTGGDCYINYNKVGGYQIKLNIKEQCKTLDIFKNFEAQDVLSKLIVQRAIKSTLIDAKTKKQVEVIRGDDDGPFLQRNIQLKILPAKDSFFTEEDEITKLNYSAVLNTNFHQGKVLIRPIGNNLKFDFEFLTENISKSFCKNGFCTKGTETFNPVMARISLFKNNNGNLDRINADYWYAPMFVPMQWTGILETADKNLFVSNLTNLYVTSKKIIKGDKLRLKVEFLDARTILDDLKLTSDIDYGTTDVNLNITGNSLPQLPGLKLPRLALKLPNLPNISLGNLSAKDLENFALDLDTSYTHSYKRICNQEHKCAEIKQNEAFDTLITEFVIGDNANGLVKLESIVSQKRSKAFENYVKPVAEFAKIVCQ